MSKINWLSCQILGISKQDFIRHGKISHPQWKFSSKFHFLTIRDDDFPRSRKTDGKRGINHWKRKTYFQTEKHGNVLLTTCCMEICNKSYQIQSKKKNVTFTVQAQRKCVQKYFCCKRTLAIVTYMYVDQFSVQSSQRAIQARHSLHAIWGQLALQSTWIIQSRSAGDVAIAYLIMWLFESTRIRNSYFFRKRNFCVVSIAKRNFHLESPFKQNLLFSQTEKAIFWNGKSSPLDNTPSWKWFGPIPSVPWKSLKIFKPNS